jgi:hypothetical protein
MFRRNSSIFREFVHQHLPFNQAQYITVTVHIAVTSVTRFKYAGSCKMWLTLCSILILFYLFYPHVRELTFRNLAAVVTPI